MVISSENLKLIRKFQEIGNKGYYVSGEQLTAVYNEVLGKRVNSTNCSACLRSRLNELVDAADKFERMIQLDKETEKKEEPVTVKEEENKAVKKAKNKSK